MLKKVRKVECAVNFISVHSFPVLAIYGIVLLLLKWRSSENVQTQRETSVFNFKYVNFEIIMKHTHKMKIGKWVNESRHQKKNPD